MFVKFWTLKVQSLEEVYKIFSDDLTDDDIKDRLDYWIQTLWYANCRNFEYGWKKVKKLPIKYINEKIKNIKSSIKSSQQQIKIWERLKHDVSR